uniref:Uncharacterized protein n=1 Tax=Lactuca sativa TaxID=4236 RepID=A0A9R1XLP4_LACSA|nr:hypothetical protein LSAT_V11C300117090 [Lactuca sativa]
MGSDKIGFNISLVTNYVLINEINKYQSGRWVSPPKGAWRIFKFHLGEMKPVVIHLPLHLENYQPLTFKLKSTLVNILSNYGKIKTLYAYRLFMIGFWFVCRWYLGGGGGTH